MSSKSSTGSTLSRSSNSRRRGTISLAGSPRLDAPMQRARSRSLPSRAFPSGRRTSWHGAGRLPEELEPPGFEALAGLTPARPPSRRAGAAKPKDAGVAEARRRVDEAKREVRARAREAVEAERTAERAETAAAEGRRAAG